MSDALQVRMQGVVGAGGRSERRVGLLTRVGGRVLPACRGLRQYKLLEVYGVGVRGVYGGWAVPARPVDGRSPRRTISETRLTPA